MYRQHGHPNQGCSKYIHKKNSKNVNICKIGAIGAKLQWNAVNGYGISPLMVN